jgi:hypothetical protein
MVDFRCGDGAPTIMKYCSLFYQKKDCFALLRVDEGFIKTLGIAWHPSSDKFQFQVDVKEITHKMLTK